MVRAHNKLGNIRRAIIFCLHFFLHVCEKKKKKMKFHCYYYIAHFVK